MMKDVTLIINIAGSDIRYANDTLRHITKQHASIEEKILIVDTLKPPPTKYNVARLNLKQYNENLEQIKIMAHKLLAENVFSKVAFTSEYSDLKIAYKRNFGKFQFLINTHDYRCAPIAAYLIGHEIVNTQYIVRYDGDMLIYQNEYNNWVEKGIEYLKQNKDVVSISPRTFPTENYKLLNDQKFCWFSTRCMLFDKNRINTFKPMLGLKFSLELILRKLLNNSYTPAFETIIHRMMISNKLTSIYLNNHPTYIIHPEEKQEKFIKLLPYIIKAIENNEIPHAQFEKEYLDLEVWETFLNTKD